MSKKNNNKGFTLAELLIVVAIIAVLVAIAIPVFTQQLEKSREATDMANARSAYAQAVTMAIDSADGKGWACTEKCSQTQSGWAYAESNGVKGAIAGFQTALPDVNNTKYIVISVDSSDNTVAAAAVDAKATAYPTSRGTTLGSAS